MSAMCGYLALLLLVGLASARGPLGGPRGLQQEAENTPEPLDTSSMKVAYMLTLTKDFGHGDVAAVWKLAIERATTHSRIQKDFLAVVNNKHVSDHSKEWLKKLGFRVEARDPPLTRSDIANDETWETLNNLHCDGVGMAAELMKLYAFTFTEYDKVVALDMDWMMRGEMDELLASDHLKDMSLIYTADHNNRQDRPGARVWNGGFYVLRPSVQVFDQLLQVVRTTPFENGWNNTGQGHWFCGAGPQGLLPYYYEVLHPELDSTAVDICVYNNLFSHQEECKNLDQRLVKGLHFSGCPKPWACNFMDRPGYYQHCLRYQEEWHEHLMSIRRRYMDHPGHAFGCHQGHYMPLLDPAGNS